VTKQKNEAQLRRAAQRHSAHQKGPAEQSQSTDLRPPAHHRLTIGSTHAPDLENFPNLWSVFSTPPPPSPAPTDGAASLAGGHAAAGHHWWHALHHGQRPVLHPQGRARQGTLLSLAILPVRIPVLTPPLSMCGVSAAEAHRERHVGRRHGAPRQEARRAGARQLGADLAPCLCSPWWGFVLGFHLLGRSWDALL
jgi:hypothetical protein